MHRLALLVVALLSVCCGGVQRQAEDASAVAAPAPPQPMAGSHGLAGPGDARAATVTSEQVVAVNQRAAAEEQAAPAPQGVPAAPPAQAPTSTAAAATDSDALEIARAKRMLDIEARLSIEVEDVRQAAATLRSVAGKHGGQITNESVTEQSASVPRAEFTLRVPSERVYHLLDAIGSIGAVRSRQVQARDIGQQYYDAVLRLRNLEVTRDRLAEILKQAVQVEDILRIEQELTRVRGEIEQIKGRIRYLSDRAALATVHVSLFTEAGAPPPEVVTPKAKLFPGLRVAYLLDIEGDGATESFLGGGLGLGISRYASLNVEGFRRLEDPSGGLDAFTATLEGRVHSEFFGGGTRRWLDPFLGLRAGYARFEGRNEILTGALLGIDIFKTETVRVDFTANGAALFGTSAGAHVTITPSLGLDVAF